MTKIFAPALLLSVAAPAPALALAQPATYHAVGDEPFWRVTITPRRMHFEQLSERSMTVATPRPAHPRYMGRIYATPRLRISIRTTPCSTGMGETMYADEVTVTVDGRTLHGCGGASVEPVNLINTSWRITAINGRVVPADRPYRLEFTDGRLSGRAGCNSFGGGYQLNGNRLTAGPLMSTRMACPGRMADEQTVLRILRAPVASRQTNEHTLEMRGAAGSISLRLEPGARPRG